MDEREEKDGEEIEDLRMKEKKDRERRRNNIIIRGANKLGENEIEQEVKEFIKKSLNIEVEIGKAFQTQTKGSTCSIVVAGLGSWPSKQKWIKINWKF